MDILFSILGKIFGVLLLLGVVGWIVAFLRAAFGIARGESFGFFLPFGFISTKRKKRP
ncbi:MAG: hypothetical protein NC548_57860 [Lachnospiraceae bacterium]|nr:hypothetical protein [Lachnospiraceae bacterium]